MSEAVWIALDQPPHAIAAARILKYVAGNWIVTPLTCSTAPISPSMHWLQGDVGHIARRLDLTTTGFESALEITVGMRRMGFAIWEVLFITSCAPSPRRKSALLMHCAL